MALGYIPSCSFPKAPTESQHGGQGRWSRGGACRMAASKTADSIAVEFKRLTPCDLVEPECERWNELGIQAIGHDEDKAIFCLLCLGSPPSPLVQRTTRPLRVCRVKRWFCDLPGPPVCGKELTCRQHRGARSCDFLRAVGLVSGQSFLPNPKGSVEYGVQSIVERRTSYSV